ncbi:MAG: HupE/UreJ family protein [Alphaproteobacteria bacterium]
MKLLALCLAIALAAFIAGGSQACAHTRSETHSSWQILGSTVHLEFTIPDLETKRLAAKGIESTAEISGYLERNLGALSEGKPCARSGPAAPVTSEPGYRRFEITFNCTSDKAIQVHSSAFFDLVPSHTNFAQIRTSDGNFIEQLITIDHQTLDTTASAQSELQSAGFFDYVRLGMMHIFTGIDHQLFLVGLILLSRKLRDLLFVVTGFTLGHSLTLALAVTGILRPHAEFIDALIGLTIALVGAEIVAESTHHAAAISLGVFTLLTSMAIANFFGFVSMPTLLLIGGALFGSNYLMIASHVRDAARLRLAITLIFGLIHGFGFAAGLLEMKLPTGRMAELLVGFNLGVEIGQVTVVLAVIGVGVLLARTRLVVLRPVMREVAAASLVAIGLYWFISRGYSAAA